MVVVVTETLSVDVVFLTGDREQHSKVFTSLLNLCPENILIVITARNKVAARQCFYTCLSVILFSRGRGVLDAEPPGVGQTVPWMQTSPGWADPAHRCRPPWMQTPMGFLQTPPNMVNKQAVRILLECMLVSRDNY